MLDKSVFEKQKVDKLRQTTLTATEDKAVDERLEQLGGIKAAQYIRSLIQQDLKSVGLLD